MNKKNEISAVWRLLGFWGCFFFVPQVLGKKKKIKLSVVVSLL